MEKTTLENLCVCYFLSQRHSDALSVFAAIDLARTGHCPEQALAEYVLYPVQLVFICNLSAQEAEASLGYIVSSWSA